MTNQKFVYTTALDKIRRMKKRKKVIQGGSSAGKTFSILPILINEAIENPGIDITVIGATIPHLKSGAQKDFLKIMKMTGRFISENWNITERKYTFTNSSTIEFVNADGDKAIGPRRNILYVNEANLIDYNTYNQLAIRTSGDIYLDFNPTFKFWAHTEVLTEDDAELLVLTYRDNEGLPETVLNELLSKREKAITSAYWQNWCKVYLDGQIGQLEGVIFQNWTEIDTIPTEAELLGYGMDFGYSNDPTTLIGLFKYQDKIILDEVIYQKGLSNGDINKLLKDNNITGEIYADSADPKSIAELKSYKNKIFPATKGPDSIMFGIDTLQQKEMLVSKRSHNLKDELNKYSWKKDAAGNQLNVPIDAFNHCIDALRYIAMEKLTNNAKKRNSFIISKIF